MYNIDDKVIKTILHKSFTSLVGKSCKRIEIIRDTPNLTESTKIDLIRDLIKEQNYEAMRDIEALISAFSQGVRCDVHLHKGEI